MDNFSSLDIDFEKLRERHENVSELIVTTAATLHKRDRLENLELIDRWDLLKAMERNIFQQEMKFMMLFLNERFSDGSGLTEFYPGYYGKRFLIKDKEQRECLLNSQEVHLSLNIIRE